MTLADINNSEMDYTDKLEAYMDHFARFGNGRTVQIRCAWTFLTDVTETKKQFVDACVELGIHPKTARIQMNQAIKENAEMDEPWEEKN